MAGQQKLLPVRFARLICFASNSLFVFTCCDTLCKRESASILMALYRSKLGPVGGGGEGGARKGGVVVDLDPLSAFALMGRAGTEADTDATKSTANMGEMQPAPPAGGGATRPRKERSASPVLAQPKSAGKNLDLGSWHVTEFNVPPAPPSLVGFWGCYVAVPHTRNTCTRVHVGCSVYS